MRGTPVYRGTWIPVELIADMLNHGASIEEILEGYPALYREKIELAPLYVKAFPAGAGQLRVLGQNEKQFARLAIDEIWRGHVKHGTDPEPQMGGRASAVRI
jgi:hypothetical protein